MNPSRIPGCLVAAALLLPALAGAQEGPQWIWSEPNESGGRPAEEFAWFRKTLALPASVTRAEVHVSCDNHFRLWVDGERIGDGHNWQVGQSFDVGRHLDGPRATIAIEAWNEGGPAGLIAFGEVELSDGRTIPFQTDATWLASDTLTANWHLTGFDDAGWRAPAILGPRGMSPYTGIDWGSDDRFETLPGFTVERVAAGVGSLIALTLDGDGNPLVSVEGEGVLRLIDADGDASGRFEVVETVTNDIHNVQGMCWYQDRLFLVGQGPAGGGLYRLDGEALTTLGRFSGGGEHGPHAVEPGPDGRLYVVIGNHSWFLDDYDPESPHRWWSEGHALERYLDPGGHARNIQAPGGTVFITDFDGEHWELMCGGMRNAYDIAFNEHGDLFTFDSDMEWDIGLPWYRPTRVLHLVPGGEYGWRTGSSKWPDAYPDSLPGAIDIGRGSPTGVVHYGAEQFPPRFRGAVFGGDWAQGLILAFHLRPEGASYTGSSEVLVRGLPLNVTDLVVEADGSLLFTTGGRGTRGGLYRLRYDRALDPGAEMRPLVASPAPETTLHDLGPETPAETLVTVLHEDDRWRRYRAMRLLETVEDESWMQQLFATDDRRAIAEAFVAVLRDPDSDPQAFAFVLMSCHALLENDPDRETRIAALRALELLFVHPRLGESELLAPGSNEAASAKGEVSQLLLRGFPSGDRVVDRQIALMLSHFQSEAAIEPMLELAEEHPFREERLHFVYALSRIESGWSPSQLERAWRLLESARQWPGGYSFLGYVRDMQAQVEALMAGEQQSGLLAEREAVAAVARRKPPAAGEPHDFDRTLLFLQQTMRDPRRSLEVGSRVFEEACSSCHSFRGRGRGLGPDLATVSGRFTLADQLEAIMQPSRQVSDQYQSVDILTKDGDAFSGLPVVDSGGMVGLLLADGTERFVSIGDIKDRYPSPVSIMPTDLLDAYTLEEVADLFALMNSRVDPAPEPGEDGWEELFDGKSLAGWDGDPELWSVENGTIAGRAEGLAKSSFLSFGEPVGDFLLEFDVKLAEGNSGLQFRSERRDGHVMTGYQADIGQQYWGSLYEEGGRGMLHASAKVLWQPQLSPSGWNHYVVEAVGDHIRIEINGVTTTDLHDGLTARGYLGFQLHARDRNEIWLRNVRLRRLDG